jgi:hypothetical protein
MGSRGPPTTAPVCVCFDPRVHQTPIFTYAFFVVARRATLFTLSGAPLGLYDDFLVILPYDIYAPRGPFGHFTPRSSVLTHTGTPVIDAHAHPCACYANYDFPSYDPNDHNYPPINGSPALHFLTNKIAPITALSEAFFILHSFHRTRMHNNIEHNRLTQHYAH